MVAQITPLPTPPTRQDPANFSARGDSFLGALPQFQVEANALASEVNIVRTDVQIIKDQAIADTTAIKDQAVSETTSIKNQAATSASQAAGSAVLADGYKDQAQQFALAATSSANYQGFWSSDLNYTKGQTVSYEDKIFVGVRSSLNKQPDISPLDWFELNYGNDLYRTPTPAYPLSGQSGVILSPTLQASDYAPLYSSDTRIHRRFEVAASTDTTFNAPFFAINIDSDSVAIDPPLTINQFYIWRCKDVAAFGESKWSEVQNFSTTNTTVNTPSISVSGGPSDVPETPILTKSSFGTTPPGEDTLLSTDWEVRLLTDDTLVWSSYNNTADVMSIQIPSEVLVESTGYVFRVRDRGTLLGNGPWGSVTATTKATFLDFAPDVDDLSSLITVQQEWNPATSYSTGQVVIIRYRDLRFVEYKSLTNGNTGNNPVSSPIHWEVVFDNNKGTAGYFGEVLGSTCVVDKGEWNSTTTYNIGDMVVVKNIPTPLTQADLTAYVALTGSNLNKNPATNPSDWVQRNGLPTGTSLAQTLGIGSTPPAVEVLINNDSGWLKFVHQGKIKYIAKKPFMHTISWNDIAKAEAVYGNRTVRIGSRLFRVSLLSGAEADPSSWTTSSTATDNKGAGAEWNDLIYRVHTDVPTDGTTTSHGGKQVGSNWWNFSDTDIVVGTGDGRATWCKEALSFNTGNRVIRGDSSLSFFINRSSGSSTSLYGWRPCLTLISEEEITSPASTLYKAEATGAGPSVASLQYDPITDTGYYGEVSSAQFYTGTQVSAACAVTSGTLQNDTEGWLKFYWHGQVLFIAKKTFRYSLSWDQINAANAIYGVNLGSTGKKTIAHSGSSTSYDVKLMKGAVKDPSPDSGGGRQWNELLYRVCAGTETGEVGANWATFNPSTDLGINSGNGSYTWCQEVYQPITTALVFRGGGSLSSFYNVTSSDTNTANGWRPCLALVR